MRAHFFIIALAYDSGTKGVVMTLKHVGIGVLVLLALCFSAFSFYVGALTLKYMFFGVPHQRDLDLECVHEAERDLAAGKAKDALVTLAPIEVINSNRGCYITLIRAAACCMVDGNCKRVLDDTDYGAFTCLIHSSDELYEKLVRYCDYTSRHGSPQAAAALIDGAMYLDLWLSPRCDLQLLQAQYCLQGGDVKRAAALCQRLWDDGEANNWNWSYVDNDSEFKKILLGLKKLAGASDEKWLTAKEITNFPENCSIYLQPLGDVNMKLLEDVRAKVRDFFGARTVILPPMPLSQQERSYMASDGKYDADHLRPDMLRRLRVPADAFSVVMITKEKIGTHSIGWIFSQSTKNGHLISYHTWLDWEHHWQVVVLSNVVVSDISRQLNLSGTFPCVTASSGNVDSMRRVKFAYSPEIQEKYRAIDLTAAKAKSTEDYKEWGATVLAP